jgi:hypothetical protein
MKRIIAQLLAVIPVLALHGTLGFLALLAYVAVTAGVGIADTSKTRATEARLNGHIAATAPAVNFVANGGSVGGSVTVNGNHTVTGSASTGGDFTIGGNGTSNNNHTVFGALGVHSGGTVVGGQWSMDANAVINSGSQMPGSAITIPGGQPHGGSGSTTIAGPQYCGSFFTGSGADNWATSVTNAISAIIGELRSANIIN